VFYKGKGTLKKAKILSYGFNQMGSELIPGIHAEEDAIRKLSPLKNKRLTNINILVIRISGKNKLQSSKPCVNCIECMKQMPVRLGYSIKNVYYSNDNGEIVKSNINKLENDEKHYTRFYRQIMDKRKYIN
jgi:hypothetical protein